MAARMADSRRRILSAAKRVVADEGYSAAQMAIVAREADVGTGTLYRYFSSKTALFAEMLQGVCRRELEVVRAIASEPGRPALARLTDAVATFADRALQGGGLSYAVIVEPMDPEIDKVRLAARASLAEVFAQLIQEAIDEGGANQQDARIGGAAIVGAILQSLSEPLEVGIGLDEMRGQLPREIAEFCRTAVGARSAYEDLPGSALTRTRSDRISAATERDEGTVVAAPTEARSGSA
jgi:AcrR family transcriptional regulator